MIRATIVLSVTLTFILAFCSPASALEFGVQWGFKLQAGPLAQQRSAQYHARQMQQMQNQHQQRMAAYGQPAYSYTYRTYTVPRTYSAPIYVPLPRGNNLAPIYVPLQNQHYAAPPPHRQYFYYYR